MNDSNPSQCVAGVGDACTVGNLIYDAVPTPARVSCLLRLRRISLSALMMVFLWGMAVSGFAAPTNRTQILAATPPMGWNDWAHYQCTVTAQTVLSNAKALVKTGLAARGYNTVTIDDCWMQKDRDAQGNLQVRLDRFPNGIKSIADAVHAMGLKFGIYEDSGYKTCGGFAGSGEVNGGGRDYFVQDARLFASWGVDYLKLDGCNVYVPKGSSQASAFRKAYAAESAALKTVGRPIVFSESAPAYFQGTPDWYDVLSWARGYGQLWREGSDIATLDTKKPDTSRFNSVLWNYAYNLPLGRFQKTGNWNDADFIIGGDIGMTLAQTRSQLTLWSMMSAPLILSSDVDKLSPQAVSILGNKTVTAIDQDGLGRMATLVLRSQVMDVLLKPLSSGDYAVAVLNRGTAPLQVKLRPADLGFASNAECRLDAWSLWSGRRQSAASILQADIATDDTAIWRIHLASACGTPTRTGTVTMIVHGITLEAPDTNRHIETFSRCLAAPGRVARCTGIPAEMWTVTRSGALKSGGRCLAIVDGKPVMQACAAGKSQHWNYNLLGNLVAADGECLSASGPDSKPQSLAMQACGHNLPNQIWSLPN